MRILSMAVVILAFIATVRADAQFGDAWDYGGYSGHASSYGELSYGDDYEESEPIRLASPRWRAVAQYGAYHTLLVPNNQWSQRGTSGRVIVPNSAIPSMDVAPPRSRYWGYSIDPFLCERYR